METVAVFILANLVAAIVSERDDLEKIARTVYDRILSEKLNHSLPQIGSEPADEIKARRLAVDFAKLPVLLRRKD